MKLPLGVVALLSLTSAVFAAAGKPELMADIEKLSAKEIEFRLPNEHPANYYIYAGRFWGEGQRDEAVFWLYVAQLRYRFHLAANPTLEKSGDPALFSSFSAMIGSPINLYAGGDTKNWLHQIDRALEWDAKTPNGFTSKANHGKEFDDTRAGLLKLRATIEKDQATIRAQREEQGIGEVGLINGVYIEERRPKMPKDWPALLPETPLAKITGSFSADYRALLGAIFFRENQAKVNGVATSYELSAVEANSLLVIAKNQSEEILRTSITLRSHEGAWVYEVVKQDASAGLAEGSNKTVYILQLNVADELVIRRESISEGKYPNKSTPVKLTNVFWNRAKRIVPAETPKQPR